jgi:hypothetical protein
MLMGAAQMIQELAKEVESSMPIQQDTYKLTVSHAPDEKMVVIPKKERSYSTNPRHSKVPRKK